MTAWIIYNKDGAAYNQRYIEFYKEEGIKLGIEVKLILVEDLEFGVRNNDWFILHQNQELIKPDFVICRVIYPLLSRQLSYMDIPVFNNAFIADICNDKAKTYQYLAKTGIAMVDSSFYKNDQVKAVLEQVKVPTVIKAVDGHGGSQVFLSGQPQKESNQEQKETKPATEDIMPATENIILTGIGSSDVVVQPLTGNRHQDLRVYVIGKDIVAAVLRTAREGFKSNFSLGGEVHLFALSEKERDVVNRIIQEFDFGLVGIDFIIGDEGELIFNEIEDVVGSRMLYQCSDINIVRLYLEFIVKKLRKLG